MNIMKPSYISACVAALVIGMTGCDAGKQAEQQPTAETPKPAVVEQQPAKEEATPAETTGLVKK